MIEVQRRYIMFSFGQKGNKTYALLPDAYGVLAKFEDRLEFCSFPRKSNTLAVIVYEKRLVGVQPKYIKSRNGFSQANGSCSIIAV